MTTDSALLDVRAAAARLGISASSLNKWRVSGDGPIYIRVGAAVRYAPRDLADWLAARRRRSTAEAVEAPGRAA